MTEIAKNPEELRREADAQHAAQISRELGGPERASSGEVARQTMPDLNPKLQTEYTDIAAEKTLEINPVQTAEVITPDQAKQKTNFVQFLEVLQSGKPIENPRGFLDQVLDAGEEKPESVN